MKLTETQRKFLISKLGVTARPKKPRAEAKKDDAITGAMDEYLRRESKVFDALRELEKVPATEKIVAAFEVEIAAVQSRVRKATREEGDTVLKQAYKDLESIKDRAKKEAETAEKNPTYFANFDAAEKALNALKGHPQAAHVQGEITAAEQKLAAAAQANGKGKHKDALARIAEAKKLCDDGKGFADQFNAYRIARAPTAAIVENMKGQFANATTWDNYNSKLTQADTDAATPTRDYAKATTAIGQIKTGMAGTLKKWTRDNIQGQIDELKKVTQIAFVDADLKQLEAWRDSVDAKITAGEWGNMGVLTTRALRFRVAATDRATRRQNYLDAKKKATDAIALLKPNPAMAAKVAEFEKILTDSAEPLATTKEQRFEEAIDFCKKIEADCAALASVADTAKKYEKEKELLGKRLTALEKLPAAPHMGDAIASLKGLQAEADKQVAPGKDDWNGGLVWLARLASDLTAAEELAKSLAGAAKAHDAAGSATDADSIKDAVAQIRAQAKLVAKPPHNDLVKDELTHITASCDEALAQAAKGQLEIARIPLKGAADLLVTAQNIKGLHVNFEKNHADACKRRDALVKLTKDKTYKAIKPKVDLIQPLLTQAKDEAKARDYIAAAATVGKADIALKEAENDVEAIKAFDLKAKPLIALQKKLKGADAKDVDALLTEARKKAKALQFDEATKLLSKAQARMEAAKIKKLLKEGKKDELVASAKEMMKLEGGKEMLDEFVKGMSGEENFDVIASLAKERFGIDLTSDEQHKTVSAKAIWEVMATVPEKHATHSPSLKSVKRETPESSGGAYSWFDKSIEMNGRPNDGKTENFDAATRNKALGLPLDHDNAKDPYAPVDDKPANLFNMTVLHEVGHAVDDRLGFMAGKAGQADYGGWKQYTDLTEIADAVAAQKKYDKNYVLQLLNGYTPETPPMPDAYSGGEAAWKKAKKAVDDWYELAKKGKIWWDHGKSKSAAIGDVVYQEAYADRWVSYLLPERTKGVTAYQWRAPGEWFAELYMAWYGKKLKPNHPFAHWLKNL